MKTPALYSKGRQFEPHKRRFFTPAVVLLSFNKPETVLWTIAKIILGTIYLRCRHALRGKGSKFYQIIKVQRRKMPHFKAFGMIIIIIIIFCYSPKHCFRLIEGQQYHCWTEKSPAMGLEPPTLGIQGVFIIPPRNRTKFAI